MADFPFFLSVADGTFSRIVVFCCAVLAFYIAWTFVYELYFSPFRNIPGPFLAKFTRFWEMYEFVVRHHPEQTLCRLHDQYGPVIRIGPNRFSIDDPSATKKIYALNAGYTKTKYYLPFGDPRRTNLFNNRDEKEHAERKRKVAGLYTMSTMLHYEPAVDSMTSICLRKFQQYADSKDIAPMSTLLQYYALEVISQITFDRNLGILERGEDPQGFVSGLHKVAHVGTFLSLIPGVYPYVVKLGSLLGKKSPASILTDYITRTVNEGREKEFRPNPNAKAEPFLQKCLELESQGKLQLNGILDSCNTNFAAGSDTTGATLSAILYYLHKNPATLHKLQQEIDTAAAENRISDPVTFKEAQEQLPYLQAVINEGIRMHPALGPILPRHVPAGGVQLCGYFFPEGAEVGTSAYALHRNKRYHGEDCTQWRPERWLDENLSAEQKAAMSFSFGSGSRVCLGKNISFLEMFKLVPQIVRRFEFVFPKDQMTGKELEADIHTANFVWLKFNCFVKERKVGKAA